MSNYIAPRDLEQIYENRFSSQVDYRSGVWRVLAKKYAIDLNPAAAKYASKQVTVIQIDSFQCWPLPAACLNVVFSSNFFEHLRSKSALERTLHQAYRCPKSGGHLIAMGPNIRYAPAAYWDFFDHYLPLTEKSLAEMLNKVGFEIRTNCPKFLPLTMVGKRAYWTILVRLYLRLKINWKLFGKQFLLIAQKP